MHMVRATWSVQARRMTLFIVSNHGEESTKIGWLGLKGERTNIKHGVVENAEYELYPTQQSYGMGMREDRRMAR